MWMQIPCCKKEQIILYMILTNSSIFIGKMQRSGRKNESKLS